MNEPRTGRLSVPPLSRERVVHRAEEILGRYASIVGMNRILEHGMCFRELYEEVIYPDHEVELIEGADLGFDGEGRQLLGLFDVEANAVFIDRSIGPDANDPRRTFTLHHEVIGHGVLQGPWLRAAIERLRQRPFLVTTEESLDDSATDRLERQANLIASHTSAPAWLVLYSLMQTFRPTRQFVFFGPCKYWLDVHGVSRPFSVGDFDELCRLVAYHIRRRFDGLSVESLSYRVAESRLMVDRSRAMRLHRVAV